jgi:hypothetical protein
MTRDEALDVVIAAAEQWTANSEAVFAHRVEADDSDDRCDDLAVQSRVLPDEVKAARDVWRAIRALRPS